MTEYRFTIDASTPFDHQRLIDTVRNVIPDAGVIALAASSITVPQGDTGLDQHWYNRLPTTIRVFEGEDDGTHGYHAPAQDLDRMLDLIPEGALAPMLEHLTGWLPGSVLRRDVVSSPRSAPRYTAGFLYTYAEALAEGRVPHPSVFDQPSSPAVPQGDTFDRDLLTRIADGRTPTREVTPEQMEQFRPVLESRPFYEDSVDRMIRHPRGWFETIPQLFREYLAAHPDPEPVPQGDDLTTRKAAVLDKVAALLGALESWEGIEDRIPAIAHWITDLGMPDPSQYASVGHYRDLADRLDVDWS